jgi:ATP-dependent protease HslVU (ClpYQ) ATPase subunit
MEGFDVNIIAPAAQDLMKRVSNLTRQGSEKKNLLVSEARDILEELESEKLIEQVDIQKEAIKAVEESGIIVVDEIDKIVSHGDSRGSDASAEGEVARGCLSVCLSVCLWVCASVSGGVGLILSLRCDWQCYLVN